MLMQVLSTRSWVATQRFFPSFSCDRYSELLYVDEQSIRAPSSGCLPQDGGGSQGGR